jgi:hypothetical protein
MSHPFNKQEHGAHLVPLPAEGRSTLSYLPSSGTKSQLLKLRFQRPKNALILGLGRLEFLKRKAPNYREYLAALHEMTN